MKAEDKAKELIEMVNEIRDKTFQYYSKFDFQSLFKHIRPINIGRK